MVAAGAANCATTTATYQVSAGTDDGFAWSVTEQDITSAFLKIGDERVYTAPYYLSAMRFTGIAIPRSAVITDVRLKISSIDQEYRGQIYGVIQAETADNALDFSSRYIGAAAKTPAAVNWDHKFAWDKNTYYTSPDISSLIQEVVNRPGWNSGNSFAIFYSTRTDSRKSRMFGSFEAGAGFAAALEVTYETYNISGYVKTSAGSGLAGVAVSADADIESTVTDATGHYELKVPPGFSGTVTPSKPDWGFSPGSRTYSNVASDQTNQDFTAFQPVISGYVKDGTGAGIKGVSVSADNSGGSDITDGTGFYELTVPYDWSGTVTPAKTGWNIIPSSHSYSNVTTDQLNQDFTAFQPKISGYVRDANSIGVEGVTVSANNGGGSDTTDPNDGYYEITVPYNWSGTVTPNKAGWAFTPQNRTYSNVATDQTNQNYTAFQPKISGYVRRADSVGVEGVLISADNDGGSDTTDSNGYYEIMIVYGWSGKVVPMKTGFVFDPFRRIYNSVISDQINQDYLAHVPQTFVLRADGTGDYPTIQAAIDAAANGDVVVLQAGTYTGSGNRDIDFLGKAITVRGATGDPNDCIIDCQATESAPHRGFKFVSGEDGNSVLEAITITNGYGPGENIYGSGNLYSVGGAVYCKNSSPHISNCIISHNSVAYAGGGISVYEAGSPNIDYCTIINNHANNSGGGIKSSNSNPNIRNCTISYNSSFSGGGIYINNNSGSFIINCTVSNNIASVVGGIYNSSSNPTISNCTITNNKGVSSTGYGIYNYKSSPTIKNCIISNNSGYTGGGIYNHNNSNPKINNCTITSNSGSSSSVTPSGGIRNFYNSSASVQSSIIWDNQPSQITGSDVTVKYSDIQGGYAGVGNINTDPLFIDDFHLSLNSPCINAGNPGYVPEPNEQDIDGDPRIIDRIDMGADESTIEYSAGLYLLKKEFEIQVFGIDSNTVPQILEIYNYGAITLNWHIENDCHWLIIEPLSGQTESLQTTEVALSIDHNNINYGIYSCQFRVIDPNAATSPQIVKVNLEVLGPQIGVNNTNFYFTAYGKSDTSVAGQELGITNTGFDTLNWRIENDCNWLIITPLSGQTESLQTDEVTINIDNNNIDYGLQTCQFRIMDPNAENSPQVVSVQLNVLRPVMSVMPSNLDFEAEKDGPDPNVQILSIQNTGYDTLSWEITFPNDCNWLSVEPMSGQSTDGIDEVTLSTDANGLDYGFYNCELTISAPDAENSPQTVPVGLHVYTPGEIHVPAEYSTIQEAINAAVDGDEVIVHPGIYTGQGNYYISFGGKAITVRSIDPNNPAVVAATIIGGNRNYNRGQGGPIFYFTYEEDANSVVDGLAIIQSAYKSSGGIYCYNSSPTIRNCVIQGSFSNGIRLSYSNAVIINCIISGNIGIQGAAVNCYRANPVITNCVISNNSHSGAMVFRQSNAIIRNCTITDNFSYIDSEGRYYNASGISARDDSNVVIIDSIIWNEDTNGIPEILIEADYYGDFPSTVTVSYSDVQGGQEVVHIDPNCTLNWGQGNIDVDPCFAEAGYLHLNNTPLDANDDFWVDGDYHLKSQAGRWHPSIYIGLDPAGDGFISLSDFAAFANYWQESRAPISYYYYGPIYPYVPADFDNSGIVDFSDLIILLDNYLADYPPGQWVFDDVTSPCVDTGDPNSDWTAELWPHGKRINMGAYGGTPQASTSLSSVGNIADLNNDDIVDIHDLALLVDMWLTEEVLLAEDIDRNGLVNFPDFAGFAENWLWEQ